MKEEIKAQWVAALRSGRYEQTQGRLQRDGSFCCMGVLCELAVEAGVIPSPVFVPPISGGSEVAAYGRSELTGSPPAEVWDWSGFEALGVVDELAMELMARNDELDQSFEEIADYIESRFLA
jgi:hypothetical protein